LLFLKQQHLHQPLLGLLAFDLDFDIDFVDWL